MTKPNQFHRESVTFRSGKEQKEYRAARVATGLNPRLRGTLKPVAGTGDFRRAGKSPHAGISVPELGQIPARGDFREGVSGM